MNDFLKDNYMECSALWVMKRNNIKCSSSNYKELLLLGTLIKQNGNAVTVVNIMKF
jgi:hypothetical protein